MPNRILRPWTDSEAVNTLDDAGEVFFVRLIQCADDYGRFYGSPQLLKSYLYPLKDKRVADITRLIAECEKAGLIAYYEFSGKRYIEIRKFNQRLRQKTDSKFPPPPDATAACPPNDGHMTVTRPSHDRHMTAGDGDGDGDERREEEHFGDKSPSCSPRSRKNSGDPGMRSEPKKIFFDYDGDAKIHGITPEQLALWKESFPALDVEQELGKASAWLDGNRKNRKQDVKRFLVNWLNRAQDRAPKMPNQPPGKGTSRI